MRVIWEALASGPSTNNVIMTLQVAQLSQQQAEQGRKLAQDAELAKAQLHDSMQLQAAKQLQAQAEQASQKAAEQDHKLQTSQGQVQNLQTLVHAAQDQLKEAKQQQSKDLYRARGQAKHLHGKLQVANQQVANLQTGKAAAEASHCAELSQLREELKVAQQQNKAQEASLWSVTCSSVCASSFLPHTPERPPVPLPFPL